VTQSTPPKAGFRQSTKRTLVELGMVLAALLGLYLGLRGCSGWAADLAVDRLPPSVDAAVGKSAAESTRAEHGQGATPTADEQQRVERVFGELRAALTPEQAKVLGEPRVTVLSDSQINAFALPGGEVFVLTGLLARVGEDDGLLRAVLAHELGHAVLRHGLRSLARNAAFGMTVSFVIGDLDHMTATLLAGASQLDKLHYSRSMESEADEFGAELLERSKHDTEDLARFLETLESAPVPELLSTHPDSAERAKAIRARAKRR
jgi:predicted Zn-dependent protease